MPIVVTQSTDDFDAQPNIRYDVYVNGRLSGCPAWFRRPDQPHLWCIRARTRSKSLPRILQATHRRRPRLPYSYLNRPKQISAISVSRETHPLYPRNSRSVGAKATTSPTLDGVKCTSLGRINPQPGFALSPVTLESSSQILRNFQTSRAD